jgi:FKBP-type peptidyl-prolyl cis-trans isomerase
MSLKHFGQAALIVAVMASCGKNRVEVTQNGLKYQIHEQEDENSRKGKVGDVLTLHLTLMNSKDSVLRDTHKEGAPFQMLLQVPPFKGSFEEGLTMLGKGDSATFYVSADSLFTRNMQPMPPGVTKGSDIGIAVKILNIQSEDEFKKAQAADFDKQKVTDDKAITAYLAKNNLTGKAQKTANGVYVVTTQAGAGTMPTAGDDISVNYTGKLMNGKVFDSNLTSPQAGGKPFQLKVGVGMVIPGWEEGIMKMRKGEKATLYIPSGLAYGPRGNPTIPANSVLIFDIDLLDVQKGKPGQMMPPQMPQQQPGR